MSTSTDSTVVSRRAPRGPSSTTDDGWLVRLSARFGLAFTICQLSVMVLMAIVTTVMAGPLFELVYGRRARREGALAGLAGQSA